MRTGLRLTFFIVLSLAGIDFSVAEPNSIKTMIDKMAGRWTPTTCASSIGTWSVESDDSMRFFSESYIPNASVEKFLSVERNKLVSETIWPPEHKGEMFTYQVFENIVLVTVHATAQTTAYYRCQEDSIS